MWIPMRIKHLCSVNIDKALDTLAQVDEEKWYENDEMKRKLAGARPTQSLFLYSIDPIEFNEILASRPLQQEDVTRLAAYDFLYDDFKYLFDLVLEHYPKGGIFTRVQLARMQPGSEIPTHYDATSILENSHRLHIPLITNKKVKFIVDDELVKLESGNLYELNNQLEHSVENPKDGKDRIHLIFDYLPPEYNTPESLSENFKYKIRKDRAKKITGNKRTSIELPKVIATSVVRGANQNESHGGVYLVDMKSNQVEQVVDWNTCDIDFSGRGWDRGLRGICFLENNVLIAASDEVFFFDKKLNIVESFKNKYLRHAHEIMIDGRFLYVTSTGFDSVLRFNLRKKMFDLGWNIFLNQNKCLAVQQFDPQNDKGPDESNIFHINNAFFEKSHLFVSGRHLQNLLKVMGEKITSVARIPLGTHNVRTYNKGIIYNDTNSDQIVYSENYDYRSVPVVSYDANKIKNKEFGDDRLARAGFGRGLCKYQKGTIIVGSSPSTVALVDLKNTEVIKSVNISMDVRNAIHGLELWPF